MFSIHIITLFPEQVEQYCLKGIFKRAFDQGLFSLTVVDLRNFGVGKHNKIDYYPFSGKKGMIIRADALYAAVSSIEEYQNKRIIYTCPKGPVLDQSLSTTIASDQQSLILIPGYYEGVDERIFDLLPIERVSIGNYILNSGDSAAIVIAETIIRQLPGVLGNAACIEDDSLFDQELEAPQYTQPLALNGLSVPDILRSGDHGKVALWKKKRALWSTLVMRPDILCQKKVSDDEKIALTEIIKEMVVKENDESNYSRN